MKKLFFVLIMLLGLSQAGPLYAQEGDEPPPEHPLMQLLALVPDVETARYSENAEHAAGIVKYLNLGAIGRIAPAPITPTSGAELVADEASLDTWIRAMDRIYTAPLDIIAHPNKLLAGTGTERDPKTFKMTGPPAVAVIPDTMGFEFFAIQHMLSFSEAPTKGTIIQLNYDADTVGHALAPRDYQQFERDGLPVWCVAEDCDGTETNPRNREAANVFDQEWGRKPAIILADGHIASAFDADIVQSMVQTATGSQSSLADSVDFGPLARALVEAATNHGELIQAYLFTSDYVVSSVDLTVYESSDAWIRGVEEALRNGPRLFASEWADYNPMPTPQMVAIADYQEGRQMVTALVALYADTTQAEAASTELWQRTVNFRDEIWTFATEPLISAFDATFIPRPASVITDVDTGKAAVVIALRSMAYTTEQGIVRYQIGLYGSWLRSIEQLSFYPIWDISVPDWFREED